MKGKGRRIGERTVKRDFSEPQRTYGTVVSPIRR